MRRLTITLLATCLLGASAAPAIAQESSPEPPPWFGGQRADMPEHGFTATVPDGWVAFDLTGDMDEQIESAAARLDGDVDLLDRQVAQAQRDGQLLWVMPVTMDSGCGFGLVPGVPLDVDLAELGATVYAGNANDPTFTDVHPPEYVELPAGPAFYITQSFGSADLAFWLGQGAATFALSCAGAEAPDDHWRSIVESFEFVPDVSAVLASAQSQSPPPWFGGRVEMPEHGVAVTVPDGWVAFDAMGDVDEQAGRAAAVLDVDYAGAIAEDLREFQQTGVQAVVIDPSTWSSCSVLVVPDSPDSPFDLDTTVGHMQEALSGDETVTHLEQPEVVELPAGPARFIAVDYVDGTESALYIGRHAGMFVFGCNGEERRDDDWLSIAETFEFLPAEE